MQKILKTIEIKEKIRENEILEADNNTEIKPVKPISDPFFNVNGGEEVEKRVVTRDGQVPKLQKNIEKEQRYQE